MSRKGNSGMSNGGVTKTSIPSFTQENLQKFVSQFGTGMTVQEMAEKVYNALPAIGTSVGIGGRASDKGVVLVNGKYLQSTVGKTTYQFIRQKSKGTWKVQRII